MHFKKILSASILASALIFCIPQAIYAAPDAKTETPVTYGWNSDALGRFFLTENGSRATGFCSIDQKVYYFDPDGYLFTPSQEGVMYLAQKPYYFLADGSVKTGLFSIKSESGISWYYAGANYQLLGVYDEKLVEPLAQVLISLGVRRGMVVYGKDKLDELSLSAPTRV